jgi:phosphate transport system substrate-binding protein
MEGKMILQNSVRGSRFAAGALALFSVMVLMVGPVCADSIRLTGSGASFPFPLYTTWFKMFNKANPSILIDYQSKGSGAGIKDLINHTVDFAASDAAMSDEDMAKVSEGVQLLPLTAGTVVIAYNLPGNPKELKLSREVYPAIFLGKITKWNDPKIAKDNPGIKMPDLDITVVRRADSSGTTFVFSQHLSAISEEWKNGPGTGTSVKWPSSDKIVAAPKNDGVTATIKQTPGSIGYIEYTYAALAKVEMASLQNKAGKFVAPSLETGTEALSNAKIPADMRVWLPDPEGDNSYPIATYTWLLCYKKYEDPKKAEALRNVVDWCLTEGQKVSPKLHYIPLPADVVKRVKEETANIK